ncbi:hypothetical protein ABD91_25665 [Lysinibacillus sphaericus]|uniref:hypothetical protein n=1 Tax=Lysinibacillus sphaericus TaxID=1421 RepID=UPI0018CEE22D|nr:hypothetical protein [Lysinibacillus sphaericus]MBG9694132.1 hypothetical protein [Lysinibacillus sphaericus]
MKNVEELINQIEDFNQLIAHVNSFLEPAQFPIKFEGYSDTLYDFYQLQDYDFLSIFEVSRACLFWSNYFSEHVSILIFMKEHHLLNHDWMRAKEDLNNPSRFYEEACLDELNKVALIEKLIDRIYAHVEAFDKASDHCIRLYNRALEALEHYSNY